MTIYPIAPGGGGDKKIVSGQHELTVTGDVVNTFDSSLEIRLKIDNEINLVARTVIFHHKFCYKWQ